MILYFRLNLGELVLRFYLLSFLVLFKYLLHSSHKPLGIQVRRHCTEVLNLNVLEELLGKNLPLFGVVKSLQVVDDSYLEAPLAILTIEDELFQVIVILYHTLFLVFFEQAFLGDKEVVFLLVIFSFLYRFLDRVIDKVLLVIERLKMGLIFFLSNCHQK